MLSDFKPRLYQETIFSTCTLKNTLVVLPTGMGKTFNALMLAEHRLQNHPNSKILFLAPTKPLVEQHFNTFQKHLDLEMQVFTGNVLPDKRKLLWNNTQIIFSTPQALENDIISNRISLKNVSLIVFDEAHRAIGDYAYVFIAKQYHKKADFPKILALTASPGSDLEKIEQIIKNLYIEDIEIRTDQDPDVKPYIQEVEIQFKKVDLPETFLEIKKFIENCIKSKLSEMKKLGLTKSVIYNSKRELLTLQSQLHARIASGGKDFQLFKSVSLMAEVMKVQHALELLESQGITSLHKYFEKILQESLTSKSKAVQNLVRDLNFKSAMIKTNTLLKEGVEHPKFNVLKEIVENEIKNNKNMKIMLFTQYRDSALKIKQELETIKNIVPVVFVGQAKKKGVGLSQKQQIEILNQFRDGFFNVLVATSVAEEGLDIPSVDLVLFYEPIPSAIRHIQRRGRTGRQEKGKVIILMAKNTRDEGYRWSAFHKEKRMHTILEKLKNNFHTRSTRIPNTLNKYIEKEKIRIFADYREKGSGTIKELIDLDVDLKLEMLHSADYVLSTRCGVEIKKIPDFVNSIIDNRLLTQIKQLKQKFERPLVILEGEEDIFTIRNIHPNAIRGMIATIAISYGIPIIYTKTSQETANMLLTIAKREQSKEEFKEFSNHVAKPLTHKEQQEYIVSSLPCVGPTAAKELLKHFKSVKNIINADKEQLKQVNKVGDKIANTVKTIVEKDYD